MTAEWVSRPASIAELRRQLELSASANSATGVITARLFNLDQLNQMHGYAAADALVERCGTLLGEAVRSGDSVLRIGDASFAVYLPRLKNRGQLLLAVQKLLRVAAQPVVIEGRELLPRLRLGAALVLESSCQPEELLLDAEKAMRSAERQGKDFVLLTPGDQTDCAWDIEGDLRRALEDGTVTLHYQPKIDLQSLRTIGAEALLRWRHPRYGWIAPDRFMPVAEKTDLIHRLTWSVINSALEIMSQWPNDMMIAVNVSPSTLHSEDFLETLLQAVDLWNRSPRDLMLEVTETVAMADPDVTHALLRGARDAGIHIAIDDFGSGYSSLAYLKNLPADELKIDKQFVLNMVRDQGDFHIVEAALDLARRFGFRVVAEGIEDRETADALRRLGCHYGQGFYFSKPLTDADFRKFVHQIRPEPVVISD
jgi:diguanylate cyclase (GGDEF)-like protein